jgi:hypothetical protein
MDTSSPPKKIFASSARDHKIASPVRMPIATAVSSNVTLNISATETSRNLSNSEPLVWSAAATSSKGAIEIAEPGQSTDINESAPAIPPMTNSEPPVWSSWEICLSMRQIKGPFIIYGGGWHRREKFFVAKILLTQPLKKSKI